MPSRGTRTSSGRGALGTSSDSTRARAKFWIFWFETASGLGHKGRKDLEVLGDESREMSKKPYRLQVKNEMEAYLKLVQQFSTLCSLIVWLLFCLGSELSAHLFDFVHGKYFMKIQWMGFFYTLTNSVFSPLDLGVFPCTLSGTGIPEGVWIVSFFGTSGVEVEMELTLGGRFKVEQDVEDRSKDEGQWPPAAGWASLGCWSTLCFLLMPGLIKSEARSRFCKMIRISFAPILKKPHFWTGTGWKHTFLP